MVSWCCFQMAGGARAGWVGEERVASLRMALSVAVIALVVWVMVVGAWGPGCWSPVGGFGACGCWLGGVFGGVAAEVGWYGWA